MRDGTTLTVLADPTRQAVLQLLRHRPLPVGELATRLPISRPAVSQHLRILRKAQLVREHREGTRHYFSLNPAGFAEARAYLDAMWQDALSAFAAHVTEQESIKKRKALSRKE
jgi:DNA-binding transcriptional ArsR family regulator